MKVLLFMLEERIREKLKAALKQERLISSHCKEFPELEERLNLFSYDILVLDFQAFQFSEKKMGKFLADREKKWAVLMISPHDCPLERARIIEAGADDCMSRPLQSEEFLARIKALYRRMKFEGEHYFKFRELELNLLSREIKVKGSLLELTPKEYDLLLFFLSNKNRILGKERIAEYLWGDESDLRDHFDFIYQHVKNLRRKLRELGASPYIQNVYGLGYRFSTRV